MNDLTGDELPSPRADPVIIREEDFDFVLRGKIPGISGELDLKRRGSDRSPTAKATTMLILVAEACLAAVTIAVICKLVAAPALLLVIAALAAFAAVLITGTIISFHRDCSAQAGPGGHVRSPDPGPGCPPRGGKRPGPHPPGPSKRSRGEERAQGQQGPARQAVPPLTAIAGVVSAVRRYSGTE
jgi:hypothetical protein